MMYAMEIQSYVIYSEGKLISEMTNQESWYLDDNVRWYECLTTARNS